MKIKILKSIGFIVVLLIILILLSKLFEPKNNSVEAGMHNRGASGILAEPDNTIDVIVVGNSEAYTSIIPMELWNEYGYTSYVCASPEQPLALSVKLIEEYTKHQKPKVVMLEASSIHLTDDLSEASDQVLNLALKVFEYHDRWKNLSREDFSKKPEYNTVNSMKGYEYSNDVMSYTPAVRHEKNANPAKIPMSNQMYIKIINKICKRINAKLIIVSTPSDKLWSNETHDAIQSFCDKNEIEYLDLNMHKDEISIDWKNETRDGGEHLNHAGALKTTKFIGKYLYESEILESHKDDDRYSYWSEQYKEYKKVVEANT